MSMIGLMINERYKIKSEIGGGGMSHVYLADDIILKNEVVVKILRSDLAKNESYIRRFKREGQAVSSLSHPNIVSIFDVGEENGSNFLVMEYVKGMTLKEYINLYSPMAIEQIIELFGQIFSAVELAHYHNIVHRDIKPQNILISNDGVVKITDFGIAMAGTSETMTRTNAEMLGSVQYVSPEQVKGHKADYRSDIYSLGIVLFEMLTGEVPFTGDTTVSIALKHIQEVVPSIRNMNVMIPQSLENVVLRATAKNPQNRYQSIREMRSDLETSFNNDHLFEEPYEEPISAAEKNVDTEETKIIPTLKTETEAKAAKKGAAKNGQAKKKMSRGVRALLIGGSIVGAVLLVYLYLLLFTSIFQSPDVLVPKVKGMSIDHAVETLESKGFKIGEKSEISSEDIEQNFVVKTDPPYKTKRKKGTKINIYYSGGAKKQKVDNYVGSLYDEVRETIENLGFKSVKISERHDVDKPQGTILEQQPVANSEIVLSKTELVIVVSKGKEQVKLADFSNFTESQLDKYATDNSITINVKKEFSDTIASGKVISQGIVPGTMIDVGTVINVSVSKGEDPELAVQTVVNEYKIPYSGIDREPQLVQVFIQDINNSMDRAYKEFEIIRDVTVDFQFTLRTSEAGRIRIFVDGFLLTEETVTVR